MRALGRLLGAALWLAAPAMADPVLRVDLASGDVLAEWPMPEGREACLTWAHSVTGGKVADCFTQQDGQLLLARSYLHDFAAGLGEVAGRGRITPAPEGGYWIEEMAEPIAENALSLRIGAPSVDHRLTLGQKTLSLSQRAAGQAARLRLVTTSAP
ncbi:DUF1850 domain-containing protein [Natronohydrobacter thiooxidans]|jgi:hypothetical protein|uniref:DUF1850 domain-containing protein n=1 Tax=Natronohydrobacter thiooxidans TaxID=87172 RepID=UPI0008FF6A86|nr:DUF1850 domain-containing protein [Natronohydrobacter thiooxidans]